MNVNLQNIESLFSRLIVSIEKAFGQRETQEIQDFIDVGEYGLALETFIDIVVEENKKISEETLKLIKELATAMSMDQDVIHEKLHERIE